MKRFAWMGLMALVACGVDRAPVPRPVTAVDRSSPPPTAPRAPVVVAFVVDQFGAWVADERIPELPPGGLLARLVREGTWVHAMRYPYAITDTAPGHAALHTGRVPSDSGIVINEILDLATGKKTSVLKDPAMKLVGPDGARDVMGSSASRLRVPTVADRLRAAKPNARILSVSLKDRGALMPAGQHAGHVIWFESKEGTFVTSTAIEPSLPPWAASLGDARALAKRMETPWVASDATWLTAHAGPDARPGEGDLEGLGVVFPHVARTPAAFRATPMADAAVLDIALAGAMAEWTPTEPLLLLISLSTSDVIGHVFGPDSWEAWDQLRKLDASLATFIDKLEAHVGPVRILLSGDHGTVSMPEARVPIPVGCRDTDPLERPRCIPGTRVLPEPLRDELEAAAKKRLGPGPWIVGVSDGYVFLSAAGRALGAERRETLATALRDVIGTKHPTDLGDMFDTRELTKRCPDVLAAAQGIPDRARAGEPLLALVCRSWAPDAGAGDFFIVPRRGSFFDSEIVTGKGTSHGTPYLHDRTVPLLVRGAPGEVGAGVRIDDPMDFTAYAALEAAFLGSGLEARTPRQILEALRAR